VRKKKLKVLAIIPARKNSKGVKNKNFKIVNKKKRLIDYTIIEAKKSKYISKIALTTDDKRIINYSKKYNLDYLINRKKELANDNTSSSLVVLDVLNQIKEFNADYVLLLQPTSPLRKSIHIDEAIEKLYKNKKKYDSLVSICKLEDPHPFKLKQIKKNYLVPFLKGKSSEIPRQKLQEVYRLNGAIYLIKKDIFIKKKSFFNKTLPFIMNENFSINIDTNLDFKRFKMLTNNFKK
jgi:N-acylneuraminate cytidylyltransferase/CMP-N,N'-diacetyllegionaminic acid synthase|tara:strand:+ start:456 stop:1163 length:708 start_codon:yes stop_codon:yes gene_type:complete